MKEFPTKKQLEDYLDKSAYWKDRARYMFLSKE